MFAEFRHKLRITAIVVATVLVTVAVMKLFFTSSDNETTTWTIQDKPPVSQTSTSETKQANPATRLPMRMPMSTNGSADSDIPTLAPMLEQALPAVVNVSTERTRRRGPASLGSGVIIDADKGYILTNNHVVEKIDPIIVTLNDNRVFEARLIGTDPETDIAVIQIQAKGITNRNHKIAHAQMI